MATKPTTSTTSNAPAGSEPTDLADFQHGRPYLTLRIPPAYFRRITLQEAIDGAKRIMSCDPNQDSKTQYILTATDPNDAGRSVFMLSAPTRMHNQTPDRLRIDVGFWLTEALQWGDNWKKETTQLLSQYLREVDSDQ